jgi:ABC-type multidrug transport system ATPase subunit
MTAALVADGVAKRYGDAVALEPLELIVTTGERVSLIGHNGSGKSTMLRLCAGLIEPSEGTIAVAGNPAGSLAARAELSYLGDQPVFYDDLSVWEHIEYIARLGGNGQWVPRATELVERLGLAQRTDDLPASFSRGLRQKAAIALAFVRPFSVMLVDEPFVGLDVSGRRALLDLLLDVQHAGVTLVVATHELATISASDRVLALRDGELVFDGTPDEADAADVT